MQAILDACDRLRDRLLFAVLHDTGMRIGEALGLRHEDWAAAERTVTVVPRVNDNGARAKSAQPRSIPVSAGLVRLYADYLHGEYGELDSDYVFVNLWAGRRGRPLTYAAVYDLVGRLRRRTGIDFDPHWCRHTYATGLLRAGTPVEVVSRLLGHASVTTTVEVYGHLSVEDARQSAGAGGLVRPHRQRGAAVRAPARPAVPRRPALLEQLLGAVRPEFRGRGARVRRRGPGVRRRRLPGRELHAGRSQPGHVPGPSPALGRRGPPGPGRVRRDDRSSVAPAAPERRSAG